MASASRWKSRYPWPISPHWGFAALQHHLIVRPCLFSFSGLTGNSFRSLVKGFLIFIFSKNSHHSVKSAGPTLALIPMHSHLYTYTYTYSPTLNNSQIIFGPLKATVRLMWPPSKNEFDIPGLMGYNQLAPCSY